MGNRDKYLSSYAKTVRGMRDSATTVMRLQLQNQAQTRVDGALQARRQRARVPGKKTAVESEDLGDIDDRIAGKTRRAGRQRDIPRCTGKIEITRDHGDYHRLNAAAVEGVCLDHKYRPTEARLRAPKVGEISPPDLATLNVALRCHQESLSRDVSWAR